MYFRLILEEADNFHCDRNDDPRNLNPIGNEIKDFDDYNGYDTYCNDTMNGCKESQDESDPETKNGEMSYPKNNSKQNVAFLENDVNDLRNLKNINGTKIVDKPSIKNSRSLPQISDIW